MSRVEGAVLKRTKWLGPIGAALALCLLSAVAVAALARPTTVTTHQTKRGKVLAALNGHTLYLFTVSSNNCYGTCATYWKPLLTGSRPVAASNSGVKASLLGTTRRKNRTLQVTYNRHPLYLYTGDRRPGQITGEGAHAFGGHWYLVNTTGNAVKPQQSGTKCNPYCQGY
jgi:predicted lipoprotein with Yx(FWY)xxD motif